MFASYSTRGSMGRWLSGRCGFATHSDRNPNGGTSIAQSRTLNRSVQDIFRVVVTVIGAL